MGVSQLLVKLGIPKTEASEPISLVKLQQIYESRNSALRGESDKADKAGDSLLKQLADSVADDKNIAATVAKFQSDTLTEAYRLIGENPRILIPMIDALSEITSAIRNERDFHYQKIKRELSPTVIKSDAKFKSARAELIQIRKAIETLWSLQSEDFADWAKDPEFTWDPEQDGNEVRFTTKNFFDKFKVKNRTERIGGEAKPIKGEFIPDLSQLVRDPDESGPVGSAATNRKLRFKWQGKDVPAGTLAADVAHDYVSDFAIGFVIDTHAIESELEKQNVKNMFQEKPWTIKFKTGTLIGWLPAE
jgi:hypothetical protein